MNKNLKIAIYSGVVPSTTFIERLIYGLAEKGIQMYLFGSQNSKVTSHKYIKYITYTNRLNKVIQLIRYSLLLLVFRRKEKQKLDAIIHTRNRKSNLLKLKYYPVLYHQPDIFHLQWAKSIEDWMWVQEFGIILVISLRGAHINYSPIADIGLANLYKNLFPKVDGFHAVSNAISIEASKYNLDQRKTKVIYSGLDLEQFPFQLKVFNAKTPLNILSVGRDHWKKGYTYALNSTKLLKDLGIIFQYTIVGMKTNEELLYQRAQLGLEKEVSFIEKLPFEEVLKTIQKADVLLLSSIEEGIANVVLEAMALGTLVVSTDCGGMKEVINNNENGFLIPIRDAEAMAQALINVSKLSQESHLKLTKSARLTIEEQHSNEKMITEMENMYTKILTY